MKYSQQRGFSLIEIMVVVVIMGLLLGIVGPAVFENLQKGQEAKVKADFANLKTALQSYKLDNFVYPSTEQGLRALTEKPEISPVPKKWRGYLEKLPKDPWENDYIYISPADNGKAFDIYTLGADGVQGGEGDAADRSYWDEPGDS